MKLRCKKGDIAIIIQNHPGCEADLGRVIHVQEAWGKHPEDGFCWKIYPMHGHTMTYLREFDNVPECGAADYVHHPDKWLLPLRGNSRAHGSKAVSHIELDSLDCGDSVKSKVFSGFMPRPTSL